MKETSQPKVTPLDCDVMPPALTRAWELAERVRAWMSWKLSVEYQERSRRKTGGRTYFDGFLAESIARSAEASCAPGKGQKYSSLPVKYSNAYVFVRRGLHLAVQVEERHARIAVRLARDDVLVPLRFQLLVRP